MYPLLKSFFKSLLALSVVWIGKHYKEISLQLVKIEAVTAYVKAIQRVRLGFLGIVMLLILISLLVVSFITMTVAFLWVLPIDPAHRPLALLLVSGGYFLIALIALGFAVSQKLWMRATGASKLVKRVTRKGGRER